MNTPPTAVIDKCLLQPICQIADQQHRELCLQFLMENFTIYAPVMLIQEIAANYFRPTEKIPKELAVTMLKAIREFRWMEHPLELIYQEVVLKKDVANDFELHPALAADYRGWMSNLDTHRRELEERFLRLYEYKIWKKAAKEKFQQPLKDPANPESPNFENLSAFIQYAHGGLRREIADSNSRMAFFSGIILQHLTEWHPETVTRTEETFRELDLNQAPYTHDCMLAYAMYLLAPVARIGTDRSKRANPCVLSGDQINNEEDEEYVTSALLCENLLTCDKRMHSMAEMHKVASLFRHRGTWPRTSILVPREMVKQVEQFLGVQTGECN